MLKRQPDTSKIRNLTGWEPEITLEDTIADIANDLGHNFLKD